MHRAGDSISVIENGEGDVVSDDVEHADSFLTRMQGYMFKSDPGAGHALLLDMKKNRFIMLHMFFVSFGVDVAFLDEDDVVVKKKRLQPWKGVAIGRAYRVIEMPAGGLDGVQVGDELALR